LLTFIKNASVTGAVTAQTFYGCNGWVLCHNSDIWAMSNPVGDFGHGDPVWANWNMGGTWLSIIAGNTIPSLKTLISSKTKVILL